MWPRCDAQLWTLFIFLLHLQALSGLTQYLRMCAVYVTNIHIDTNTVGGRVGGGDTPPFPSHCKYLEESVSEAALLPNGGDSKEVGEERGPWG